MGVYYFCAGKKEAYKEGRTEYIHIEECSQEKKFESCQTLCYFKTNQWNWVDLGILK